MDITREARAWLLEDALPFWAEAGVDRARGGFVEHMTLDGVDARPGFKRTRVIARQIYAFSHGALLGFAPGRQIARAGLDFLTRSAWLGDDRGWARLLDQDGRVIDDTPDLYDLSFVLFALAWHHRATGDDDALIWADRTRRFIDTQMRSPCREGFVAEKPDTGWRKQNPHMHLLEAALAHYELDRTQAGASWRRLADELAALCKRRFLDSETGALREFFADDWSPAPGADGRRVEPGHLFEWAWLLGRYTRLTGVDMRPEARRLIEFAERFGVDPKTRRVFDAVDVDGAPLERSSRLWTNCERIQAAVARYELFDEDPRPVIAESASVLMRRYLKGAPNGAWIDHLTEDGRPMVDKIPSSSLYHITLAIAEMQRVAPATPRVDEVSDSAAAAAWI